MLVACALVNRTAWRSARTVHVTLFLRWPRPRDLARADRSLEDVLRPLGFAVRRAALLRRMASAWLSDRPREASDVMNLPGCGRYAADSWAIFVDGARDLGHEPSDRYLSEYLRSTSREGVSPCD